MGGRGDAITSALLFLAVALFILGAAESVLGLVELSTNSHAAACLAVLFAIYLEVYAHRE